MGTGGLGWAWVGMGGHRWVCDGNWVKFGPPGCLKRFVNSLTQKVSQVAYLAFTLITPTLPNVIDNNKFYQLFLTDFKILMKVCSSVYVIQVSF